MTVRLYQVDAFTDELFKGNPAAVIPLESFWDSALLQNMAMENNLSETAFVVPRDAPHHYNLRWFTPTVEVDFCGHATLATAHVLRSHLGLPPPYHFHTQIGTLSVTVNTDKYALRAPVTPLVSTDVTPDMKRAFPIDLEAAFWGGNNLYLIARSAQAVRALLPNHGRIRPLSQDGVVITAKDDGEYDFISRYFVPAMGIDEDPVTGSTHAALGPYWSQRLGKTTLTAYQASQRGGVLSLEIMDDHVLINGSVITYLIGDLMLTSVSHLAP